MHIHARNQLHRFRWRHSKLQQRRITDLEALGSFSQIIIADHEKQKILDNLVQQLASIFDTMKVGIGLCEDDQLVFTTSTGSLPQLRYDSMSIDETSLTTWAYHNREAVLAPDLTKDPRYTCIPDSFCTQSKIVVPIVGRREVLGVINVESDQVNGLDNYDLKLIQLLSSQLALMLEYTQVLSEDQQRRRELEALQELAATLSRKPDLEQVLHTVVRLTSEVFSSHAAALFLLDERGEWLTVRAAVGLSPAFVAERSFSCESGMASFLGSYDQVAYSVDVQKEGPDGVALMVAEGLRSMLSAPLFVDGIYLGMLSVYSRSIRSFSAHDRRMIGTLARHGAQVIVNAQYYEHERLLSKDMEHAYAELLHTLTELGRAQQRLLQTERLRAIGELTSGVAHDFNNVLVGILGSAQILLAEADENQRQLLEVIEQAALDGRTIVRRIQEHTRNHEAEPRVPVDLTTVIDGALAITRPRWHAAQSVGQPISVRREVQELLWVEGNAPELREVLVNLIINALDAMPTGGTLCVRTYSILSSSQRTTDDWQLVLGNPQDLPEYPSTLCAILEVSDTGIGISSTLAESIFEPFFTTKGARGGSGLGLAICKTIANQHGGTIAVESALGQGTIFRVTLPLMQPEGQNS